MGIPISKLKALLLVRADLKPWEIIIKKMGNTHKMLLPPTVLTADLQQNKNITKTVK